MRREVAIRWRLREVMAAHGYWKTTDLVPLLAERGVELSASQVFRLVTQPPERLSLRTLGALCDILECGPGDLIEPFLVERKRRRAAATDPDKVVELHDTDRPRRARIIDDR